MKQYRRHDARAVAANPDGKLRGPNGRRLCRWCGTEVEPPRLTFCGDACVHEWSIRSSASYARAMVWERDKGVCSLCGVDTKAQATELNKEYEITGFTGLPTDSARRRQFLVRLRALHIPLSRWNMQSTGCWDMDHTTPVIEGGGSCGLDNLRTLCLRCHWQQTRRLKQRRSRRKKTKAREIF